MILFFFNAVTFFTFLKCGSIATVLQYSILEYCYFDTFLRYDGYYDTTVLENTVTLIFFRIWLLWYHRILEYCHFDTFSGYDSYDDTTVLLNTVT